MKKLILTLAIGLMAVTAVHAQQVVVIERPGILSDLASATGAIISLPFAAIEGVVVGTVKAAGSLIHGSTQIVVASSSRTAPAPIIVAPAPVMVTLQSSSHLLRLRSRPPRSSRRTATAP